MVFISCLVELVEGKCYDWFGFYFVRMRLMVKINVIGISGSGKIMLVRWIVDELVIFYIEMDRFYWCLNW